MALKGLHFDSQEELFWTVTNPKTALNLTKKWRKGFFPILGKHIDYKECISHKSQLSCNAVRNK